MGNGDSIKNKGYYKIIFKPCHCAECFKNPFDEDDELFQYYRKEIFKGQKSRELVGFHGRDRISVIFISESIANNEKYFAGYMRLVEDDIDFKVILKSSVCEQRSLSDSAAEASLYLPLMLSDQNIINSADDATLLLKFEENDLFKDRIQRIIPEIMHRIRENERYESISYLQSLNLEDPMDFIQYCKYSRDEDALNLLSKHKNTIDHFPYFFIIRFIKEVRNEELVLSLIDRINKDQLIEIGQNCFHILCYRNFTKCLKILMATDVYQDALIQPDAYGATPLAYALFHRNIDSAQILFSHFLKIDLKSNAASFIHFVTFNDYRYKNEFLDLFLYEMGNRKLFMYNFLETSLTYLINGSETIGHELMRRHSIYPLTELINECNYRDKLNLLFLTPNKDGNTILMEAANAGNEIVIEFCLSYIKSSKVSKDLKGKIIHHRNNDGVVLLELLVRNPLREGSLGQQMILLIEKQVHDNDKIKVLNCLRENVGTNDITTEIVNDVRKMFPKDPKIDYVSIICVIISGLFYLLDTFSDCTLIVHYVEQYLQMNCNNQTCDLSTSIIIHNNKSSGGLNLKAELEMLDFFHLLVYSLIFFLLPIPIYGLEAYYQIKLNKMYNLKTGQLFFQILELIPSIIFWPIVSMMENVHYTMKYWEFVSHSFKGAEVIKAKRKMENGIINSTRALLIHTSIKACFLPLIRTHVMLPGMVEGLDHWEKHTTPYLLHQLSIFLSIFSLTWAMTSFYVDIKKGSLDLSVNFRGRILLFFSHLFQIGSRHLLLVIYSYVFNFSNFHPLMFTLFAHFFFMAIVYAVWQIIIDKEVKSVVMIMINSIYNGLSNIYLHLWMEFPQQHKPKRSTLTRQVFLNAIFILENMALVIISLIFVDQKKHHHHHLKLPIVVPSIFAIYILGIIMKWIYYQKFHVWSDLIGNKILCKKSKRNGQRKNIDWDMIDDSLNSLI